MSEAIQRQQNLTPSRREVLASLKAQGRLVTKRDMNLIARDFDCPLELIQKWDQEESVNLLAMKKFQPRAFQSIVKHWGTVEKSMKAGESWAWRIAAQISTIVPVGGVSFQQNIAVDARTSGVGETRAEFSRLFWERVKKSRELPGPIDAEHTDA